MGCQSPSKPRAGAQADTDEDQQQGPGAKNAAYYEGTVDSAEETTTTMTHTSEAPNQEQEYDSSPRSPLSPGGEQPITLGPAAPLTLQLDTSSSSSETNDHRHNNNAPAGDHDDTPEGKDEVVVEPSTGQEDDHEEAVVDRLLLAVAHLHDCSRLKDRRLIRRFASTRDYDHHKTLEILRDYAAWYAEVGLADDSLRNDSNVQVSCEKTFFISLSSSITS